MKKSGLADSPFFAPLSQASLAPPPPHEAKKPDKEKASAPGITEESADRNQEDHRDTTIPRNQEPMGPRHHDTTVSRYQEGLIETIRNAVKALGKEAATHRFTPEEKKAIADLIYTYRNKGLRTSENEVARIGVNFILQDYRENGEESILARTLKALNQ